MDHKNYVGSKNAYGVMHTIINNIPFHTRYWELFAGSAKIYYAKKPAQFNVLNDLNKQTIQQHVGRVHPGTYLVSDSAMDLIARNVFTAGDFIYLDPPYPFSSRRSGKKYYKHEMTDEQHIHLLQSILSMPARVMISTRQNELYDHNLAAWRKITMRTADRAGVAYEQIYMNYDVPGVLHQYDYVGSDFTDRQRIKRKVDRFDKKIQELPSWEKHMLIQQMIENDLPAVKHFLSMFDEVPTDKKG